MPLPCALWKESGMIPFPSWITGNTGGRGGWCMSAVTMIAATVSRRTMERNVSVSRAFPTPCCAGGSGRRCCRWIRNWKQPCYRLDAKRSAVCGALFRPGSNRAAADLSLAEDEYIDPDDGLIHCKHCGGNRQTVVPCFGKSGYFMPRCVCPCQAEAEHQRKEAEAQRNRMESIKRRRAQGLQDHYLYDYTFANDNG